MKISIICPVFVSGYLFIYLCLWLSMSLSLFVDKGRGQKKNGIMWEKFPSGGPPLRDARFLHFPQKDNIVKY